MSETVRPGRPWAGRMRRASGSVGAGTTRSVIASRRRACPRSRRTRRAGRSRARRPLAPPSSTTVSVGEHDLDPGHVVRREPVLEAVRAARVLRDVAADRAHDLARRVGRIEVRRRDSVGDREVRHARLGHDARVRQVDLEDPPQPREPDQDAVLDGQRAAREPGARAARHPRHLALVARAHDPPDLVGRPGQDRGARLRA